MKHALNLGLFLALTPALAGQADVHIGPTVVTTLTDIRAQPDAFKQVNVVFRVQFASLGRLNNPFFTRFVPSDFANFYGWAEEQEIWKKPDYEDVFGMLFLSKQSDKLQELYSLGLYERLEVHGVVRNTFQNIPWIEVMDFSVDSGRVDTTTLAHMYRGEQYMEQRRWQRAIAELSLAQAADAPTTVKRAAHRGLGICYLRIGEAARALAHLREVVALSSRSDLEVERLVQIAENSPGVELDRAVDPDALKDYERPMWEAFAADTRGQSQRRR